MMTLTVGIVHALEEVEGIRIKQSCVGERLHGLNDNMRVTNDLT